MRNLTRSGSTSGFVFGLIAIFVMVAVFFVGGKIKDMFANTGSSVQNAPNGLGGS